MAQSLQDIGAQLSAGYLADDAMETAERLAAIASQLYEALVSVEPYIEDRADCDHNGTGWVPNGEMRLLVDIREALAHARGEQP